jgi:hypothetical protein
VENVLLPHPRRYHGGLPALTSKPQEDS